MDALVTMTGWLGAEVERRELPTCTSARFRLAHTPRVQRQGEWTDGETTWLDVNCYRALAENAAASLHKGDPVIVSGRLRTERWTGRTDNLEHERLVLEAVAIGPDLNLGRSMFSRFDRAGLGGRREVDRDEAQVEEELEPAEV